MGSLGYNLNSVVADTLAVDSLGSSAVDIPADTLAGLDNPDSPDIAPDSYLSPINKSVKSDPIDLLCFYFVLLGLWDGIYINCKWWNYYCDDSYKL